MFKYFFEGGPLAGSMLQQSGNEVPGSLWHKVRECEFHLGKCTISDRVTNVAKREQDKYSDRSLKLRLVRNDGSFLVMSYP